LDLFDKNNQLSKKVMQDMKTGDISLPILLAAKEATSSGIEIEDAIIMHKDNIATTIKNEIITRKNNAQTNLKKLSFNANQLIQVLDIVTKRAV
jgi:geranylgeranyl pyrophosphate synthase